MKKKLLAALTAGLIAFGSLAVVDAAKPIVIQEQVISHSAAYR